MASEIKMPQLSDTMDSGKILTWFKKEGDNIVRGDILAEVETDKANLQIESFQNGTLLKIHTPAGTVAKVGEIIAVIGAAGEATGASTAKTTPPAAQESLSQQVTSTKTSAEPAAAPLSAAKQGSEDKVKASPLARKLAEQKNIDLTLIAGSGPNGRIIKKDLEAVAVGAPAAPTFVPAVTESAKAAAPVAAKAPTTPGSGTFTPLSKMRETIARRMQESVNTSPHFYVTTSINMGEAIKLRERIKEIPEYKGVSINHLVIKAAAFALSKEPRVNAAMKDGQLYTPAQINVGIITAVDDGLLIPVIKDTNTLSLRDLVFEAKAAVDRARAGRPSSADLSGGTFSISNMGMFDVESFTAIINPGQGGILAVSSVKEVPVVENGQIVVGSIMRVTLSVDHRIIDGVMAGKFLKHLKEALEMPAMMLL
jgi:pyruvate dehydrogenase E2 component (dihydrolipoamide acetyltransferase)